VIALSSPSIAARSAASKIAELSRLDVLEGIDRLGRPTFRAGALGRLLTLRVLDIIWHLRRFSACHAGFRAVLFADFGPECLQRLDGAATSAGAHA
jgi:hypothetical protein